jgi:hypothetical protein
MVNAVAMRLEFILLICAGACASDASSDAIDAAAPIDADPTVLRVGGEYATAVSLEQSTCPDIAVQSMQTIVSHTPGATELTLAHAGQTYSGTVGRDGAFATEPHPVGIGEELHTLTIGGNFSTSGFEATVDAAVTRNGTPVCDYVVSWVGTKSGDPNVIPG